jgi:hypothetical protein
MSVVSFLVFDPDRLPSIASLRAEAARAGDPIAFSSDPDLRSYAGYLPVSAFGRDTGFEFYFDAVHQEAAPDGMLRFGSHRIAVRTGSDFEEGRAALLFLRVAARLTGGAYAYPDDGIVVSPNKVQPYLSAQIAEYGRHIK